LKDSLPHEVIEALRGEREREKTLLAQHPELERPNKFTLKNGHGRIASLMFS
jgi:hypothetical protein